MRGERREERDELMESKDDGPSGPAGGTASAHQRDGAGKLKVEVRKTLRWKT